ncbi:MAG: cytochrome P450 [Acidimicrobiales bacterium]
MTDTSSGPRPIDTDKATGTDFSPWPVADPALDAVFAEVIGTPSGRSDPYSRYRALREVAPVYKSGIGLTICTRYDECQFVLRDPRFGKDEESREERIQARFGHLDIFPRVKELISERRSLLFLNPPDHTRLRSLVSKAFTPRTVERLRPEIYDLVDGLLDRIETDRVTDVMDALAFPLPANVISHMLGVPEEDWPRFRTVVSQATALLEPIVPDEDLETALVAQAELEEYFHSLAAKRRSQPREDLLSQLIAVQEGSDRLSEIELISTVILLFGAGFETTTNLIGNGLFALLTHPAQLDRLRADLAAGDKTAVLRAAVEELLRWDSPVQFDGRQAFEEVDICGVRVSRGSEIVTVLGAANRDPEHFSMPETLDLRRAEGPPMSFASGIHFCLGASLARAEGQVVFERLLDRFSSIDLVDESPEWRPRVTLRGLVRLPVVLSG